MHQIFQILLNKKKIFFILFLLIIKNFNVYSIEVKSIIAINNSLITNLDLEKEFILISIIEKKQFNFNNSKDQIIERLIKYKIKELEVMDENIKSSDLLIKKEVDQIVNAIEFDKLNINNQNQEILKKRLLTLKTVDQKWNNLIIKKFYNKLSINIDEINDKIKDKNVSKETLDKIIIIEKTKKINSFSETYYNEIKRKYYIKKF